MNNKRWKHGLIKPWWEQHHRSLPYVNEPFNDPVTLADWQLLGFNQTRYTGDLYDMRNPEPAWIAPFRQHFPWQLFSWSVYRMGPGTTLPEHSDTYSRFCSLHNINNVESICRVIVYLEDWQSGHYGEIDGVPLVKWEAGDWIMWRGSTPHVAANVGRTDRYTLQITGIPNEDPFLE